MTRTIKPHQQQITQNTNSFSELVHGEGSFHRFHRSIRFLFISLVNEKGEMHYVYWNPQGDGSFVCFKKEKAAPHTNKKDKT